MKPKFPTGERGAALLMTCLVIAAFLLLAGALTDLARAWVAREDLQTAVDAAALAGAAGTEGRTRYVEITVGYGHCETCCDEDSCWCCCQCDPPVTLRGTEKYLVEQGGWRRGTCCDRFLGTEERWIRYPADTRQVAEEILNINWPDLLEEKKWSDVTVYPDYNPYGPSVRARTQGSLSTVLLKLAGIDEISPVRCGQSGTFYDVVRDGWFLGRNRPPLDACSN